MKTLLLGITLACITLLSGCNTVKGFGQDLQQGGQELQKAATDNSQSKSSK